MRVILFFGVAFAAMLNFCSLANADILIGIGAPFTGDYGAYGVQIQKGAEAAADEINASGGINGEKILFSVGDDAYDPAQGMAVANKFVSSGVKFVIGHVNSGVSIYTSDVYARNGILMVSPASTNPTFTDRPKPLWNTFRTCGRDDRQGNVAAAYIAEKFKDAKIAIVDDKTPYGRGLANATAKTLKAKGVKVAFRQNIDYRSEEFSPLVARVRKAGVTLLYWGGLDKQAGQIMRQLAENDLQVQFVSGDGIITNRLASIAGDAVAGTLNTFAPQPANNPAHKYLVEKFRAAGIEPVEYAFNAYAAVQSIAAAATAAKSTDPKMVAKAMKEKGPFKTVLGDISYDKKGDSTLPGYVMYKWAKAADGSYSYYPQ
ncbi:branched-chain amino acid ABC transporter substrate-binding protein [Phyllobacterium zundukense]|uniref:Branched chain amino acid ABC transporter substrate-binding protein n=1 Tax=Phyllobacterium zundukense TaxID=1867719 RepID=A0A2N9VQI6_9HYPH|nr:branched-chain amino acid ABC transporter substrate-binding protein [Phyllobacterium zundukense]ATU94230.1 branched chain amino acid ABC transporter substrate-binding protein [Phyllobacterium zundukense]PIO41754.1 branched chain amino acid ABC transporter substrate-binding protein [Phyllobacterium zundukense]